MSKSSERSSVRWQGFRRAEAAMFHASKIYHGSHDVDATLKAADRINEWFAAAALNAVTEADDLIPRVEPGDEPRSAA